MGCHTWFSVPYITDKNEIIAQAQLTLDNWKGLDANTRKMYQYAIDSELCEPVCDLAGTSFSLNYYDDSWVLYLDIKEYSLLKYNEEHGTEYKSVYDKQICDLLESYSDEPRIGGYPEKVIRSFDELIEFMKEGYTNEEGKHFDFYFSDERIDSVLDIIKQFFINHPKGIITFG